MDQRRQTDARVYVVSALFFLCIISGGIFLCLYIFLPESQSADWYSIAGMTLVAVPWTFWFLTCIYRCFRPAPQNPPSGHSTPSLICSSSRSSCRTPTSSSAPAGSVAPPATNDSYTSKAAADDNSLVQSSGGGDQRRVHFGSVIVVDNNNPQQNPHPLEDHDVEKGAAAAGQGRRDESGSESEMPLRLSV